MPLLGSTDCTSATAADVERTPPLPAAAVTQAISSVFIRAEMTMGQRVTGHGSSGSTNLSGSRGSRRDPLTHDFVFSQAS